MSENFNYTPKYAVKSNGVLDELRSHILADGFDMVLDLFESKGSYLYNALNSEKYLDFFSCFASMPVGFNHPKMATPEFVNYMGHLALNKPSNSDIYTEVYATFLKTFFKIGVPDHFKYAFFIEGGALANENALKAAFDWKVRKNHLKGYSYEKGHKVIHFKQAFHGRTGYTMSLTNTDPVKVLHFPKFDWPRISNPKITFPLDKNFEAVIALENLAIKELKQAFIDNPDDIASIIIEPIQAEGGDNHFRPEFLQELRHLADENEALLIFDEVQTGVGITGSFWAHQKLGVNPDIVSFGKKMQICGILVGDRINDVNDNVFHKASRLNSTWGGNLIDMARVTKYLEILEEEKIIEGVEAKGNYLMNKLYGLEQEFPQLISNVRGLGLMCAMDIKSDIRSSFLKSTYENKMMILGCGDHSIRFRTPLNISETEINQGIDIMKSILKKY